MSLIDRARLRLRAMIALFRRVAGMNESPHRLSLGLGIGMFIGFLPIMGIQMYVVLPLAVLLRANKMLAVAAVWISNPVTFLPLYYVNYRFGLVLYKPETEMTMAQLGEALTQLSWDGVSALGGAVLIPLLLGSTVLGVVFGVASYFGLYAWVQRRRRRDRRQQAPVG